MHYRRFHRLYLLRLGLHFRELWCSYNPYCAWILYCNLSVAKLYRVIFVGISILVYLIKPFVNIKVFARRIDHFKVALNLIWLPCCVLSRLQTGAIVGFNSFLQAWIYFILKLWMNCPNIKHTRFWMKCNFIHLWAIGLGVLWILAQVKPFTIQTGIPLLEF